MKTTVSTKGQIVLPADLRQMDGIEPGQEFDIERVARGDYRLTRRAPHNEGVIEWLLACPHKNFFTQIDSESTDDLKYLVRRECLAEPTKPAPDQRVIDWLRAIEPGLAIDLSS